jgi:hypothetical protein
MRQIRRVEEGSDCLVGQAGIGCHGEGAHLRWMTTTTGRPALSASQFPANREFNREFFKFGPFSAILAPNQQANSNACSKIP